MVAALDWHDFGARTWLQGNHRQPVAATVRLTVGVTSVDWAVTAGTTYDSADAILADWNATLAGLAVVEIVPDLTAHRGYVRVRTTGAAAYSIAWSHAGSGVAIRDRLGESGNVSGRASGTTWASPVRAAWYSWLGAQRIQRSTREIAGRRPRLDGLIDTQYAATTTAELDVTLRFGCPPAAASSLLGHQAFRAFLDDLWDAAGGGEPFALRHLPEGAALQTWRVAFAADDLRLVPAVVDGSASRLWELPLSLVAETAPW